jgi:excisionase family DNA binding protein
MAEEASDLMTVEQVAKRLQLHPATIRRWIKSGKLRGISLGSDRAGFRVRRQEVDQIASGAFQTDLTSGDDPKLAA